MSITYPTSIDAPVNPTSGAPRNNPSLSGLITDLQAGMVALETKVGANSSADTTSQDFKLSGIPGGDKAASKTGTETLTNKTLTAPVINIGSDATGDMYYRDGSGHFQRLAVGASSTILNIDATTALPTWIANPAASNASTTVKGVGQEATQALTDAGTELGSTGAINIVTPAQLRARLLNTGVVDTGSANAYAIAPSPVITAYATYQQFSFKATNTNTGASTLAVSSLATKAITKNGTIALTGGEIINGQIITVVYDGTQFQLVSPNSTGNVKYANGVGTFNAASSTLTVTHGLTVPPKRIIINARLGDTTSGSSHTIPSNSNGFWDASGQGCVYDIYDVSSGVLSGNSNTQAVYVKGPISNGSTQIVIFTGIIGNVTATTFDIVFTSTNPQTGVDGMYFSFGVEA